jgi:hypothetical protein
MAIESNFDYAGAIAKAAMPDACKVSQLTEQLDGLNKVAAELAELSEHLEQRLQPVLRQENPTPVQGASLQEKVADYVPHAAALLTKNHELAQVAGRLRDILHRLEV